jgi:LysR family glycine cleavage system transcriptional activator
MSGPHKSRKELKMRKNLPSMSSLQAFEATGRHLSFTRAATELGVTQGAVSQRIAKLEVMLGTKLFSREGNSLYLTPIGKEFLVPARAAIVQLAQATDHAVERQHGNMLSIGCLATFAINALIPRLREFRAMYPDTLLRIRAFAPGESPLGALLAGRAASLLAYDYDVLIQFGAGPWPGMVSYKLADEDVFPVCSPMLQRRSARLKSPRDLKGYPIILNAHPLTGYDYWPLWLEKAGALGVTFAEEIHCDPLYSAIQAAVDGLGVMMGRSSLVQGELSSGRLIEPFSVRLRSPLSYQLVVHRDRAFAPKIEQFCQWALKTFGDS